MDDRTIDDLIRQDDKVGDDDEAGDTFMSEVFFNF